MCYTNVHWWILLFLRSKRHSFLEKKQAFCFFCYWGFGMLEQRVDGQACTTIR
jgi:hypothetical protein